MTVIRTFCSLEDHGDIRRIWCTKKKMRNHNVWGQGSEWRPRMRAINRKTTAVNEPSDTELQIYSRPYVGRLKIKIEYVNIVYFRKIMGHYTSYYCTSNNNNLITNIIRFEKWIPIRILTSTVLPTVEASIRKIFIMAGRYFLLFRYQVNQLVSGLLDILKLFYSVENIQQKHIQWTDLVKCNQSFKLFLI